MTSSLDERGRRRISYGDQDAPVMMLTTSSRPRNPYYFTGRRLHVLEDLTQAGVNDNRQVQYNRARHYTPTHGRWLQRDPSGYTDGMNLYEYVTSRPTVAGDPLGLWGGEEHNKMTYDAAVLEGMTPRCARILASWNEGVDNVTNALLFPWFHFNYKYDLFTDTYSTFGCGRDCWGSKRWTEGLRRLSDADSWGKVKRGLEKIGESLHAYQDATSHQHGGGTSSIDRKTHWAKTMFDHAPAEICLLAGDGFGLLYEGCKRAKRDNPNWGWANHDRPDDTTHFATDFIRTKIDTASRLRSMMSYKSVRCHCK